LSFRGIHQKTRKIDCVFPDKYKATLSVVYKKEVLQNRVTQLNAQICSSGLYTYIDAAHKNQ
ncbi:MAG: hypothetical protein Q4P66_09780, partial [Actinomycetaceae bacterium]|nr:hypothetical protein [Actinomycetaceae bacterium]